MKKTEWFGPTRKPDLVGVYETDSGLSTYQYWNGRRWGFYAPTLQRASLDKEGRSEYQSPKWRGLAQDPNAA